MTAVQNLTLFFKLLLFLLELLGHFFIKFLQLFAPKGKKSLKNEVVLVTGAASGIGQLMAYKFASQGAKLIICWDINQEANKITVENLIANGYKAVGLKCDLSKKSEVYLVAEKTKALVKSRLGDEKAYVTMLVNNAGVVTGKNFLECSDSLNELTMDVNWCGGPGVGMICETHAAPFWSRVNGAHKWEFKPFYICLANDVLV